ncbi:dihydrolipoyllysine-residue acetyltransferase [Sedimenticola selenatireducens]|uniref:Acetyltransferase component of pyruvate dehydrogenase complex n=1 Tax=Sedimenticola selenatireducens TaxID=191960 RepID=A0A2N6D134_9GAMM|nr:dihydrolipoyllysine-residue acetyltransferase [Sedimenticola selenatireducens]PLX63401.1 MAG: dihydrolipoyllysine-residue acetyltransferase [Sedimenticola selenatireducens]
MTIKEILVPDIGDFSDVELIEILVAPGDTIAVDDPLITLESDKASMEIPSSDAGVAKELKVSLGDKVSEGSLILLLEVEGAAAADKPAAAEPAPAAAPAPTAAPVAAKPAPGSAAPVTEPAADLRHVSFERTHASPSVRRIAREKGIDLNTLQGTGRKGRITQEDLSNAGQRVLQALASGQFEEPRPAAAAAAGSGIPAIPEQDFSRFGEVEFQPLSKIKRLTGINLSRAWLNVPHVTHHDETDITEVEAFRKSLKAETEKQGVRVTLLSFFMKACAATLKAYPTFNSSLDGSGENLILKKYINIGVAVDTPNGLVVPVIRDVDQKSIFEISAELMEMSAKARDKKLKPGDMQGATFTISSLGGIGGTAFTPIVNAPEVAILGLTRSQMKPVWNGSEFIPRLMQPMSLSYDHRVIDGAQAAHFVRHLGVLMNDVRRLLL